MGRLARRAGRHGSLTIEIRAAQPSDLPRLLEIEADAGLLFVGSPQAAVAGDGQVHANAFRPWTMAGPVWVAEADGAPVGFAACEVFGDELHLWQLSVAMGHQGRGMGRALVERTLREAAALGLAAVTLTTFRGIAWNAPFYAKLGFHEVAKDALGARLEEVLAHEADLDLDMAARCAMRRPLEPRGLKGRARPA